MTSSISSNRFNITGDRFNLDNIEDKPADKKQKSGVKIEKGFWGNIKEILGMTVKIGECCLNKASAKKYLERHFKDLGFGNETDVKTALDKSKSQNEKIQALFLQLSNKATSIPSDQPVSSSQENDPLNTPLAPPETLPKKTEEPVIKPTPIHTMPQDTIETTALDTGILQTIKEGFYTESELAKRDLWFNELSVRLEKRLELRPNDPQFFCDIFNEVKTGGFYDHTSANLVKGKIFQLMAKDIELLKSFSQGLISKWKNGFDYHQCLFLMEHFLTLRSNDCGELINTIFNDPAQVKLPSIIRKKTSSLSLSEHFIAMRALSCFYLISKTLNDSSLTPEKTTSSLLKTIEKYRKSLIEHKNKEAILISVLLTRACSKEKIEALNLALSSSDTQAAKALSQALTENPSSNHPIVLFDGWGHITVLVEGTLKNFKDVVLSKSVAKSWDWKAVNPAMRHRPGIRIEDVEANLPSEFNSKPGIVILSQGRGTENNTGPGELQIVSDVKPHLEAKGHEVHILKTAEALVKYNELRKEGKKDIFALIHTTC